MDRQKIILFINKYISYLINFILVAVLVGIVLAYGFGMVEFAK